MDDHQFRRLLEKTGRSWRGYRKVRKGVIKRIRRHMHELGCREWESYLSLLKDRPDEQHRFDCLLTVSISRFFRDRNLWQYLESDLLPSFMEINPARIKVWSAGSASGEEVYSLKILWANLGEQQSPLPLLDITATDLNPEYLERAKAGIYPPSSLRDVPPAVQSRFFSPLENGRAFSLKASLKEGIRWEVLDMLSETPGSGFDLIFLRNSLLTYYDEDHKRTALGKIVRALAPGGCLVIGSHEKIPFEIGNASLDPMDEVPCILRRRPQS